jgi:gamma-glutamylputrescine oxidase
MTQSIWLTPAKSVTHDRDLVIVGGGLTGLSLAYWMKQIAPHQKVTLLEKGQLGSGASGRNAGFVTCGSIAHYGKLMDKFGSAALEHWRFCEENITRVKRDILADDDSFHPTGSYTVFSAANRDKLEATANTMIENGISVDRLSKSEVFEASGFADAVGGGRFNLDGMVNPINLLGRLRALAAVDAVEDAEVFQISTEGQKKIVRSSQGTFRADKVIVALNGYTASLLPALEGRINPIRAQMMAAECDVQLAGPCYVPSSLVYYRNVSPGLIGVGGLRILDEAGEVGTEDTINVKIQEALEAFMRNSIRSGSGGRVIRKWSGIMGYTQDLSPVIAEVGASGLYVLGGYSGHGMGLAFMCSKVLIEHLYGRPMEGPYRVSSMA